MGYKLFNLVDQIEYTGLTNNNIDMNNIMLDMNKDIFLVNIE